VTTSRATIIGVTALTAAVVGFGATAPSLADNLGLLTSSEDATTDDGTGQDETDDAADDQWPGPRGHHRMGGMGGVGMGGPGGGMGMHGPGAQEGDHPMLATAAESLGLSEEDLLAELRDGQTLGQVADAQGVDRQVLVDALLADHEERITQMLDETMPVPGQMRWQDDDGSEDGPTSTSGA
jgi:hypothetical protein